MPETSFCEICFISLPSWNRRIEYDFERKETRLHNGPCYEGWIINESTKIIRSIANDLKVVCGSSARYCKKIKKDLRAAKNMEAIRDLFSQIVGWIKERFVFFQTTTVGLLEKLYEKINFLAEKLGIDDEIICFPLPIS